MALGDIKVFDYAYNGLTLRVIAIDNGNGTTDFQINCTSGSADINALWWGDETIDGSSPTLSKSDNSLNMNGTGVDWDGYAKLSSTGLGSLGWDKPTALTVGETYFADNLSVNWDDIDTLGIRATSTSTAEGSIKGVDSSAVIQVLPTIAISDAAPVTEGGTAEFTITLSNTYAYDIKVYFQSQDGTAKDGSDYSGVNSFVIIPAGQTTATVLLNTIDNAAFELTENFTLEITSAVADIPDAFGSDIPLTVTDASGTGTITDDDPMPSFAIDDVTRSEADGTITFTVTKTGATEVDSTVDFVVNPGTAGTPDDYTGTLSGTLNFLANETTKTITLTIEDDATFEETETFTVDLSNALNATISDSQGIGTITDDDPSGPAFGPTLTGSALPATYAGADPNDHDSDTATATTTSWTAGTGNVDDVKVGNGSDNTISGGNGNDVIYGGAGNDTLNGNNHNDELYGQAGTDTIDGGNQNDLVFGGSGDDIIFGGAGTDQLYGGSGNDTISGNDDADIIIGGYGADILTGNGGADVFKYLSTLDTNDTIHDFLPGTDVIDLSAIDAIIGGGDDAFAWAGQTPTNTAQVLANSVSWYTSGGTVIVLADTDGDTANAEFQITLLGITSISETNFVL